MKRQNLVAAFVAVLLTTGLVWAQTTQTKPADTKPAKAIKKSAKSKPASAPAASFVENERKMMATMVRELDLSDQQQAMMNQRLAEKQAIEQEWQTDGTGSAKGAKLAAAQKICDEAAQAQDRSKLKPAATAVNALNDQRDGEIQAALDAFMAVLTPEQTHNWHVYLFYSRVAGAFGPAKLTDEQKAKVRELVEPGAEDYHQIRNDVDLTREMAKKYQEKVVAANILTPEQNEAMGAAQAASDAKKAARDAEKAAAEARKPKAKAPKN